MSFLSKSGFLPHIKPLAPNKVSTVSILDVGTSKICCLIGKLIPREDSEILRGRSHKIEVLGIGHQRARGIKSGVIVDLETACPPSWISAENASLIKRPEVTFTSKESTVKPAIRSAASTA